METQNQKNNSGFILGIIGFIVAVLVVGTVYLSTKSSTSTSTNTVATIPSTQTTQTNQVDATPTAAAGSSGNGNAGNTTVTSATTATAPAASSSTYKNGTYTASATYQVPHGSEGITATLTVQNDLVTDVSITQTGDNGESQQYQSRFASSYKQYVVGKSLSSLSLNRISGASDTTDGFNSAVATIKSQAQA